MTCSQKNSLQGSSEFCGVLFPKGGDGLCCPHWQLQGLVVAGMNFLFSILV